MFFLHKPKQFVLGSFSGIRMNDQMTITHSLSRNFFKVWVGTFSAQIYVRYRIPIIGMKHAFSPMSTFSLNVVTNEKEEASRAVLDIRCWWGTWCWMFFCHFNGLPA
jgi:hypothetical protein